MTYTQRIATIRRKLSMIIPKVILITKRDMAYRRMDYAYLTAFE